MPIALIWGGLSQKVVRTLGLKEEFLKAHESDIAELGGIDEVIRLLAIIQSVYDEFSGGNNIAQG